MEATAVHDSPMSFASIPPDLLKMIAKLVPLGVHSHMAVSRALRHLPPHQPHVGPLPRTIEGLQRLLTSNRPALRLKKMTESPLNCDKFSRLCKWLKTSRLQLSILELTFNNLGFYGAKSIAEALRVNGVLKELKLFNNCINPEGAKALADALRVNAALKSLDISWNQLDAEAGKALADALSINAVLTSLSLAGNSLTNAGYDMTGVTALAEALKVNAVLKKLHLSYNYLTDEGTIGIGESLKTNKSLEELHLRDCFIGPKGAKAFAGALRVNAGLKKIVLSGNEKIKHEGAIAILESLKTNKNLEELHLRECGIGPEGAKTLADTLRVNTVLKKLDVNSFIYDVELLRSALTR